MAVVGSLAAFLPASSSADEVDTRCKNGAQPVHYSLTVIDGVLVVQARVLCIRD